jgi:hypothetical protein
MEKGSTAHCAVLPWMFEKLQYYRSIENCARRFCCQQLSVWSVQNCFSLP